MDQKFYVGLGARLVGRRGAASDFEGADIDREEMAARLKAPSSSDGISLYLHGLLSAETRRLLASYSGGHVLELERALAADLSRIIRGGAVYDPERFQGTRLSRTAREMLASKPDGLSLRVLNRVLLEDAYPLGIRKRLWASHYEGAESGSVWVLE